MKTINVIAPFGITKADASIEYFTVGVQEVSDETAAHWYVQAHSEPVEAIESAAPVATRTKRAK